MYGEGGGEYVSNNYGFIKKPELECGPYDIVKISVNSEGKILKSNTETDLDGKNVIDFLPQGFKNEIKEMFGYDIKDFSMFKEPVAIEFSVNKSGDSKDTKWQRWEVTPEDDGFYKIIGTDITNLEKAERDNLIPEMYGKRRGVQIINELNKKGGFLTIGMGDLNGLKLINDTMGHGEGNKKIQAMGKLLLDHFGEKGAFRWGGDEFVIVIPGHKSKEEISEIINSLKKDAEEAEISFGVGLVSTRDFKGVSETPLSKEVSGGIDDPATREALNTVDFDMYKDKNEFKTKQKKEDVFRFLVNKEEI